MQSKTFCALRFVVEIVLQRLITRIYSEFTDKAFNPEELKNNPDGLFSHCPKMATTNI